MAADRELVPYTDALSIIDSGRSVTIIDDLNPPEPFPNYYSSAMLMKVPAFLKHKVGEWVIPLGTDYQLASSIGESDYYLLYGYEEEARFFSGLLHLDPSRSICFESYDKDAYLYVFNNTQRAGPLP